VSDCLCMAMCVCICAWIGGCQCDCCILRVCLWGLDVRVGFSLWLFVWGPGCGERLWWLCLLHLLVGICSFIQVCGELVLLGSVLCWVFCVCVLCFCVCGCLVAMMLAVFCVYFVVFPCCCCACSWVCCVECWWESSVCVSDMGV